MSLYITRTSSRFHNSFGILCSSFLLCNLQGLFIHITWCIVVLSVKSPILSLPELFSVRLVGLILNGGWFGTLLLHFLTALNRFYAFVYATKYNNLWSESRTLKMVVISWIVTMVYCTHHLYDDCSLLFNYGLNYRWLHYTSFHGQICAKTDAVVSLAFVISMACFDFFTSVKIIAYRRTMARNRSEGIGSAISEKEVRFFKQSCKLGSFYVSSVIGFNVFPHFFANKWILFMTSTMLWILAHSLDG
uniref:7TM_GPCR_Srx domain-containing protein n=1 Tax=Elaeophora elaphi TaxID=1147741 RepID=A0A0R3S303_9BILA